LVLRIEWWLYNDVAIELFDSDGALAAKIIEDDAISIINAAEPDVATNDVSSNAFLQKFDHELTKTSLLEEDAKLS